MIVEEVKIIEVKEGILSENDELANKIREKCKDEKKLLINLMASPGAGKTSLIINTLEELKEKIKVSIIEADIDSSVDSEKISKMNVDVVQLKTGGFCHLDANMINDGLENLNNKDSNLVIIENVGNLVCPAEFDTGALKNVMILSIPEGDDKPLKYPLMFSVCDVLIINKVDYFPFSDFNMELFKKRVYALNSKVEIFEVSCKTKEGLDKWTKWLHGEVLKIEVIQN